MKKTLFATVSGIALVLTSFVYPTSAQEKEKEKEIIIFEKKEEKDIDKLYQRAIKGISDDKTPRNLPEWELKSNNKNDKSELKQYFTTQVLKIKKVGNTEIKDVAVTVFGDVNLEGETPSPLTGLSSVKATTGLSSVKAGSSLAGSLRGFPKATTLASWSKNGDMWDSSGGVHAYSTIFYTTSTSNGTDYAILNSANGSWYNADSGILMSNKRVNLGSSGWPHGTQSISYYPSGNTWQYSAPTYWDPVSMDAGHTVGATSIVTLKRGTSSTWTLTLSNNM